MKDALINQLNTVFSGEPWYGDSMLDVLDSIPAEQAVTRLQDRSILLFLRHILAWRDFTLRQLRGESDYRIQIGGATDWPVLAPENPSDWSDALGQLKQNQEQLLEALRRFPEERLTEMVPGRKFNFAFLINGVVQHDIYHLGQITLLRRLIS